MSNYIDISYIVKRADETELKDVCDTTDLTTSEVALNSIIDAEAIIDEYLESIYTVPLTTPSDTIKRVALSLSVYYMYSYRYQSDMPDNILSDYKLAIKYLENVSKQKHKVLDQDELTNESTTIVVNKTSDDKYFTSTVRSQIL